MEDFLFGMHISIAFIQINPKQEQERWTNIIF
jgi:hypothetical protein